VSGIDVMEAYLEHCERKSWVRIQTQLQRFESAV
jgi:hypothetical protein